MDTDVRKQIEEFSASVRSAIDMFKSQDTLVKALQEKINWLEQRMLDAPTPSVLTAGAGFQDVKLAGEFVTMVKSIFIKDDDRAKDMTEGRDQEGGYLVRPEYRSSMISIMEQYGLARQRCTVIPMSTTELIMPKLTGGVQVYWIGEGQTIPQTQPAFGEFRMTIKKLAALVPMTSELLNDANIAIANLLATLFAQALAKEEDRVVFAGNFVGGVAGDPFNGVLYDPGVKTFALPATMTTFAKVTADDLADVIASQPPALIDGAQFYFHRTILNVLRKLKDKDDNYIWAAPTADGQPGTIWGYPYTLCELMPGVSTVSQAGKPFMFFGNLKHYYIGDRQQLTIARSEHVGFAQDKTFLRILQREGMAYAIPETGVVVKAAAA
jgi:HK97 family phage major capsid protein